MKTVTAEEILAEGGTHAWAKKNNYHNTGKNLIGRIKLTKKLHEITTKALLADESKECPL